jgi:hypothetical protein
MVASNVHPTIGGNASYFLKLDIESIKYKFTSVCTQKVWKKKPCVIHTKTVTRVIKLRV